MKKAHPVRGGLSEIANMCTQFTCGELLRRILTSTLSCVKHVDGCFPAQLSETKHRAGVLTCTQNALRQSEVKESGEFAIWADLAGFKWNEKSGQRASAARKRFGSCNRIYAPVEMPSSLRSELQITNRSDSLTRI